MGYLFRDERLIELMDRGREGEELALILARGQALVAAETEHIIALNDEFVWRRIKRSTAGRRWRSIGVRCIGCLAVAPLGVWVDIGDMASDARVAMIRQWRNNGNVHMAAAYDLCEGPHRAAQMLDMLYGLLRPDEPTNWVLAQGRRQA